jgi:alkylhydroperoxidase family enzyme
MARLPSASREQFPEQLKYVWDAVAGEGDPPNIFRAMGNNPALLRAYLRISNGLWNHCGLDLQTRELAILRTAILKGSTYEWHQHVRIGRDAGLSDTQINALWDWKTSPEFNDREKAVFAYIDAMHRDEVPHKDIHSRLASHFDAATITGVCLLTAYYAMTATFLAAMEVETEEPFVGWRL